MKAVPPEAILSVAAIDIGRTDGSSVHSVRPSSIEELVLMGQYAISLVIARLEDMDQQAQRSVMHNHCVSHSDAVAYLKHLVTQKAANTPILPLDRTRTHLGRKPGNKAMLLVDDQWRESTLKEYRLEHPKNQRAYMAVVEWLDGMIVKKESVPYNSSLIATPNEFTRLVGESLEFRVMWASATWLSYDLAPQRQILAQQIAATIK